MGGTGTGLGLSQSERFEGAPIYQLGSTICLLNAPSS